MSSASFFFFCSSLQHFKRICRHKTLMSCFTDTFLTKDFKIKDNCDNFMTKVNSSFTSSKLSMWSCSGRKWPVCSFPVWSITCHRISTLGPAGSGQSLSSGLGLQETRSWSGFSWPHVKDLSSWLRPDRVHTTNSHHRVSVYADRDRRPRGSRSDCSDLHPSAITIFTAAQTDQRKPNWSPF